MKRMEAERWHIEKRVPEKHMGAERIPFLLVGLISLFYWLQESDLLDTFRKEGILAE